MTLKKFHHQNTAVMTRWTQVNSICKHFRLELSRVAWYLTLVLLPIIQKIISHFDRGTSACRCWNWDPVKNATRKPNLKLQTHHMQNSPEPVTIWMLRYFVHGSPELHMLTQETDGVEHDKTYWKQNHSEQNNWIQIHSFVRESGTTNKGLIFWADKCVRAFFGTLFHKRKKLVFII